MRSRLPVTDLSEHGAGQEFEQPRLPASCFPAASLGSAAFRSDEGTYGRVGDVDGGRWAGLSAYVAKPQREVRGGLVVVQEIFGVNEGMRRTCDSYAEQGFLAIAPALFDRFEKGVDLMYEGDDLKKAYELYGKLTPQAALLDVAAGFKHVAAEDRKTAVLGFCYGGFMSWLAATRSEKVGMSPACCVGYYAGGIGSVATEEPNCPVLLHFGKDDSHIGKDQIDAVHAAHDKHAGEVQIFLYEGAGHAFANDARGSFVPEAAALAWERSLEFLREHMGEVLDGRVGGDIADARQAKF